VKINGKHFGCYRTIEEAAHVADAEAVKLYGKFTKLNFPAEVL
jgi:hypothetical protein